MPKKLTEIPIKESEIRVEGDGSALPSQTEILEVPADPDHGLSPPEVQALLRQEAYQWPRLVFPPLKKGGHIILDACTVTGVSCYHILIFNLTEILGQIMRITITKSQGKQPYYDARKSKWGDIFPHPPKKPGLVRFVPVNPRRPSSGVDIGKRGNTHKQRDKWSYEAIAGAIRENRKVSKREYERTRGNKVWEDDDD